MSRAERDRVRAVVAPAVQAAGLVLEDVVVQRTARETVVRVVVDLDEDAVGSVDLDTLGEASRAVSEALDVDDVVHGPYSLEVTSPGTDRPLVEPRHFRRARGRLVDLRLRDGGSLVGRLQDVDDDVLVLLVESGPRGRRVSAEQRVELARVDRGRVQVELSRPEQQADGPAADPGDDGQADDDKQDGRSAAGEQEQG